MTEYSNPFEYEQASKLSANQINDYYIDEFNYGRFVKSKRNIFLVGERGTGKTMILRYYSFPVNLEREKGDLASVLKDDIISVYVTCNTPLSFKKEYQFLKPIQAAQLSEHYLVVSVMHAMITTVGFLSSKITEDELTNLKDNFEYIFGLELMKNEESLYSISAALDKSNMEVQRWINDDAAVSKNKWLFSFVGGVLQLISMLKKIEILKDKHFSFMIDDAHLLNDFQIKSLNSWIAYRDNTNFSLKVARTKVDSMTFRTSTGGTILEGHDFTDIDLVKAYLNKVSAFGRYARLILKKRLNISKSDDDSLEEYFPEDEQYKVDYKKSLEIARAKGIEKYGDNRSKKKSVSGYVTKMARAYYFRSKHSKSNIPIYSGLDTIIQMSNGVVRHLLHPCYYMYDRQYSENSVKSNNTPLIKRIDPKIQNEIIIDRSNYEWDRIKTNLPLSVEGCSSGDAQKVYNLLNQLANLFRERLLKHKSEPRAVSFTISETEGDRYDELIRLIKIARKAQLIFTYRSTAKDRGERELYYMPNRILWPVKKLDSRGLHARVSIKSSVLYNAAVNNKSIPYTNNGEENEPDLFIKNS